VLKASIKVGANRCGGRPLPPRTPQQSSRQRCWTMFFAPVLGWNGRSRCRTADAFVGTRPAITDISCCPTIPSQTQWPF